MGGCEKGLSADDQFVALANRYLEKMRELNPEWATNLGDHRFDDRLSDMSRAGIQQQIDVNRSYQDSFRALPAGKLSTVNRIDYQILSEQIASALFQMEELREYEWNPQQYNVGGGIYNLLARDSAPLPERLASVKSRLEAIPSVLAAARQNLKNPPRVHTETAILQNSGMINLIMDELQPFLEKAPELRPEFTGPRARAIAALEDHGRWLEEELLPRSSADFRLGDALYRKKLHYSLASDISPEQILATAERDLKATQKAIYETARPLHDGYFGELVSKQPPTESEIIKHVLDKLSENGPNNENIVELARESLAATTDFVRRHDLATVPDEPLQLIVMPEFQRGVAIAYCDSPGPLEEGGETFYSIAPPPRDWSAKRVESFFREYNMHMLEELTIHEAMPGHYLQIAYSNEFEAPTLTRAIFGSGTFVEGWATYAEQIMADAGYGGPEVKMQRLKMRLRLIINAIIDQKIHTAGMTKEEAMQMMMEEGFQEEGEAAGKWRRACLTSAQLSTYYVGNMELNALRRDYEAKMGEDFDLKTFHHSVLSFGSPPPKYIRELLDL
jgi:uncharacterized protein (DUF885 family)